MESLDKYRETAVLVGLQTGQVHEKIWKMAFEELQGLVETAGAEVVSTILQARETPDPATYIGKGKLQELTALVSEMQVDIAVFDSDLSPAQVRNLEQVLNCKVLDRTQVILDIFAGRAQTKEGKLQVELAQLNYLLPRLTGRGAQMSRLGGGIGTRGPGETQLEVDRRRIRDRIADLRRELKKVRSHREVQRQQRKKREIPVIAMVGYTNAGKSTLLHTIIQQFGTGSQTVSAGQNRLFDTLDPTARRTTLPDGRTAIFTDTVGFIQELPHQLIDSFRATLEETLEADVLLHVVDVSHPQYDLQMNTVYRVLEELGASDKDIVTVYNKSDLIRDNLTVDDPHAEHSLKLSALTGEGVGDLIRWLMDWLNRSAARMEVLVPYTEGSLLASIHEECRVYEQEFVDAGIRFVLDVQPKLQTRLMQFQTQ